MDLKARRGRPHPFPATEPDPNPTSLPMSSSMAVDDAEDEQLASMSTDDIVRASHLLDNEIRVLKDELQRTNLELESGKEKIKENQEKIRLYRQLPYLVGNIDQDPSIH